MHLLQLFWPLRKLELCGFTSEIVASLRNSNSLSQITIEENRGQVEFFVPLKNLEFDDVRGQLTLCGGVVFEVLMTLLYSAAAFAISSSQQNSDRP